MWFGCLVHVRKAIEPIFTLGWRLNISSFPSNAIPPHHGIDVLHLSETLPLLTTVNLPFASQA